jgi:hypothetical protein
MPNKRLYYATAGAAISPDGTTAVTASHVIHGLQSVTIDADLNLERIFEIGQSEEYESIEDVPEVSISLSKVLDGYCPMYLLASNGAVNAELGGRADITSIFSLYVYPDDHLAASGTPLTQADCSGCNIGSLTYNFPVDDNFTEEMDLVASHRNWRTSSFTFSGNMFDNTDTPLAITGSGGVNRREDLIFSPVADGTILPSDVAGITSSGTNESSAGVYGASLQNISVSVDFAREELRELGRFKEFARLRAPVTDITTEIEAICKTGDLVNINEEGGNTNDRQIVIKAREGLKIDLGLKNRLQSTSMGGFDAGGDNATMTYTFSNANKIVVTHPQDITTALRP